MKTRRVSFMVSPEEFRSHTSGLKPLDVRLLRAAPANSRLNYGLAIAGLTYLY